ncbi:kinase-like protein [Apiospora kogelbergensis]|uniref:kinase-like protein n=1 Tax=Apiospora kogelbergensis TaxID=1337665 RepID=UPI00312F1812
MGNEANGNAWSKLGIEHPRVNKCHDRGNDSFDKDVPMPVTQPQPTSLSLKSQNWKELSKRLSKELNKSVEDPEWGGANANFLPRKMLRKIITPERVRVIVAGLGSFKNSREVDSFVHTAFHGENKGKVRRYPSVKLLAALVCCGATDRYLDLVSDGVSDICLPPVYAKRPPRSPLKCKSNKCNNGHTFLGDLEIKDRKEFYAWTYYLNAPYFSKPKHDPKTKEQGIHNHYVLSDDDVLPIISSREQQTGTSTKMSRQRTPSSGSGEPQMGGFSTVTCVEFHPEHYDFGRQDGEKHKVFALKKLTASDPTSFNQEIASLLAFIAADNQHLVKLLASFEIQSYRNTHTEYYFLFPWADGTLWDFWKLYNAVEQRANLSQWMSHQCYRLAEALQFFHNERNIAFMRPGVNDIEEGQKQLFGRHGDIKAENILWFKTKAREARLVLNDFGLARLNSKISRSAQDPNGMPRTKTYQAPEFDVPGSKISRSSDIFSLGCAFLEFATWFVEGFDSVDVEFVDARMEVDPHNPTFELDTFFRVIEDADGKKTSMIKPKVTRWIQRLRTHDNCTQFIADFLDLIEQHMLEPDPKKRYESDRVVKRLWELEQSCRTDTTYWKDHINSRHGNDRRRT